MPKGQYSCTPPRVAPCPRPAARRAPPPVDDASSGSAPSPPRPAAYSPDLWSRPAARGRERHGDQRGPGARVDHRHRRAGARDHRRHPAGEPDDRREGTLVPADRRRHRRARPQAPRWRDREAARPQPRRKWRTVLTRKLTADGVFKAYPKPGRTRYYKLVVAASATRTAAVSKPVTITVRPTARQKIVAAAVSRIGKPYVYGASGPNAFDCSGLTAYAYRKAGVALPHSANGQKRYGRAVSKSAAKPGDLVVFYSGGYAYHAAIYAGNGYIYEAARPGTRVGRHRIWSSAIGFRRVVG
ncbi:C40 family peptidase [Luedemannella flava]